jgi:hypothetical protein
MNKSTATGYDALLGELCKQPRGSWHISMILRAGAGLGYDATFVSGAVSTFTRDGFLKIIEPFDEDFNNHFELYGVTNAAVAFILHEGGYRRKRRFEAYGRTNVKFTVLRHWVWFYTAIVSLLVNGYFILKYLLEWL